MKRFSWKVGLAALLAGQSAGAQTWNDVGTGNWNVAGNWTPATVPTSTSTATLGVLSGAYSVQITDTEAAGTLNITSSTATLNMSGTFTASTVSMTGGTLNFTAGTMTVNTSMAVASAATANWTGGTLTGSGTLTGTILASGGSKIISGSGLQNAGTLAWSAGTILTPGAAIVQLTNAAGGTINFQADGIAFDNGAGGAGTLVNLGTLLKSGASPTPTATTINWAVNLEGGGTLNTAVGTLDFNGGGILSNGTTITMGAGLTALAAGTFTVPSGQTFTAQGTAGVYLNWTGGTMTSGTTAGTLAGTITASGGTKMITGTTLQLGGTLNWSAGTITTMSSSTVHLTVLSGGFVNFQADGTAFDLGTSGTGALFNLGTILKTSSASAASSTVVNWAISNSGTIGNYSIGALNLNGVVTNSGIITMTAGATIGGTINSFSGGSVQGPAGGTGTYSGAMTFNTGSALNPGAGSPGRLNFTGTLTLASGATFTDTITGTTAITGYGQISVAGTTSITASTLQIEAAGASIPNTAKLFIVLDTGSNPLTGTFAGLANGATVNLVGGGTATISYFGNSSLGNTTGGNDIVLYNFVTPTPEPGWTAALLAGAFGLALRLRRRAIA